MREKNTLEGERESSTKPLIGQQNHRGERDGSRSILGCVNLRRDGRCSWRRHLRGAAAEYYRAALVLARWQEKFFFASPRGVQSLTSRRPFEVGERVPFASRQEFRYSVRQLERALKLLVQWRILIPAEREVQGRRRSGWLVRGHDSWARWSVTGECIVVGKSWHEISGEDPPERWKFPPEEVTSAVADVAEARPDVAFQCADVAGNRPDVA